MKLWSHLLIITVLLGYVGQVNAKPVNITITSRDNDTTKYVEALLFLASQKTSRPIGITNISKRIESPDWRNTLAQREIRIIWSAETQELNHRFKKIPIDIYQGLMGYRACVTHKDNMEKLDAINNSSQLRTLTYGSGDGWRDTEVLINHGMTVITGSLDELYSKAERKEIDCYSRAVFEIYSELDDKHNYRTSGMALTANQSFVLQYENPFYFYVRKDDAELFSLILEGLTKAIHDGSFIETLQVTRQYRDHVKHMRREGLSVIELD